MRGEAEGLVCDLRVLERAFSLLFFKRELTVYEFRKRFIIRQSQSAQLPVTFRS